jgi:hypothetical protein
MFHIAVVCAVLSACTTTSNPTAQPYRAPDPTQPSVQLTVAPPLGVMQRRESERLSRHDVRCQPVGRPKSELMNLASWYPYAKEYTPKAVALPVGRVYFNYEGAANRATCTLNFSAELEVDHAYAIETRRNFRGLFKGSECVLTMLDTSTGKPVQLDYESAHPDFGPMCRAQSGEQTSQRGSSN